MIQKLLQVQDVLILGTGIGTEHDGSSYNSTCAISDQLKNMSESNQWDLWVQFEKVKNVKSFEGLL